MSAAVGDGVLPLSSAFNLGGVVVVSAVATVAVVAVLAEGAAFFFGLLAGCKQYSAENRATMSATLCVLGGYSFMCFPTMTNIFLSIRLRKPYYNISAMYNSSLPSRPTQATFLHALTRQDSCNHADYGELCPCSNLCNFS